MEPANGGISAALSNPPAAIFYTLSAPRMAISGLNGDWARFSRMWRGERKEGVKGIVLPVSRYSCHESCQIIIRAKSLTMCKNIMFLS